MSRHKLHDFIDSFSHGNNKRAGDLCKSTLVDDDSYDDRRTRLSFKAYDSDSGGGVDCPIQFYAPIYNATRRNSCQAL